MADVATYVPVVRWKQGERKALRQLTPDVRELVVPIIEPITSLYVSKTDGRLRAPIEAINRKIAGSIVSNWGQSTLIVDAVQLAPFLSRNHPIAAITSICRAARELGARAVPSIRRLDARATVEYRRYLHDSDIGVCVRLDLMDLELPDIRERTKSLLSALRHDRDAIDLVVDYGCYYFDQPKMAELLRRVGGWEDWRSITMLCGSFPKDLSEVPEGMVPLKRREVEFWQDQLFELGSGRLIRFGDYGTQYPIFNEPPEGCNPSVSIRYTSEKEWLVCRGQGVEQAGTRQWIGHSAMLVQNQRFHGGDFSAGTRYVLDRLLSSASTGNFSTWLQAGFNHHICVAARQVNATIVR
jgi:hypothetical protein